MKTNWIRRLQIKDEKIAKQADEIRKLRVELAAIKPSWADSPEWAEWLCMERATAWWWYELEPEQGESGRILFNDGRDMSAMDCRLRDTLEHRPEKEDEWMS